MTQTMSCPSGGRLSTSSRSIWAFCTACILELMVPISACWAELYVSKHIKQLKTSAEDICMRFTCLTSGGMWPRCIWPMVICCWADGMVPTLRDSVPMEPDRITPGSATEPCSTRPTRLNCCCRMVDLPKGDNKRGCKEAVRCKAPQIRHIPIVFN